MALFIIGAGASRGASFARLDKDNNKICLPPLDTDFFTQLQRIQTKKHQILISNILAHLHKFYGSNYNITLEQSFSAIDNIVNTSSLCLSRIKHLQNLTEWTQARKNLVNSISAVLEESMTKKIKDKSSTRTQEECEFHKRLIKSICNNNDVIITYNYDCLIDYSLKNHGKGKWNAKIGYGIGVKSGHEKWTNPRDYKLEKSITLLKLHGSMNFSNRSNENDGIILKVRPYTTQHGYPRYKIIPPISNKKYDDDIFRYLTRRAAEAIENNNVIVFIGYSLPEADLHSSSLLRAFVSELDRLVIVNPDKGVRSRIRSVLQKGITEKTRINVFDTFEEFVGVGRELWDPAAE